MSEAKKQKTSHDPSSSLPQTAMVQQEVKPTAVDAVLDTTELLEMILLALPMRDILILQRINSVWRELIATSIHLRRALFREPVAGTGPVSYIDWRLDDKDCYEGKLDLGPPLRGEDGEDRPTAYPAHWGKTRDDAGIHRVFVNPLLRETFPVLKTDGIYFGETRAEMSTAIAHPQASWQGMLLTQPPIHSLSIEHVDDGDDDVDWTVGVVSKEDSEQGITMSTLFTKLESNGREGWIEGRELWEAYTGFENLSTVVVQKQRDA